MRVSLPCGGGDRSPKSSRIKQWRAPRSNTRATQCKLFLRRTRVTNQITDIIHCVVTVRLQKPRGTWRFDGIKFRISNGAEEWQKFYDGQCWFYYLENSYRNDYTESFAVDSLTSRRVPARIVVAAAVVLVYRFYTRKPSCRPKSRFY